VVMGDEHDGDRSDHPLDYMADLFLFPHNCSFIGKRKDLTAFPVPVCRIDRTSGQARISFSVPSTGGLMQRHTRKV